MAVVDQAKRRELKQERNASVIVLPDVKMRPKEMVAVGRLLSACDRDTQGFFILLMEQWARAGQVVGTTPQSIALDAPCGKTKSRIAVLLPGDVANPTSGPPVIVLTWNVLRTQKHFPAAAVTRYQCAVKRCVQVRETESSAHIRLDGAFGIPQTRRVLQAMLQLARSVRPDLAEAPSQSKPVTPENVGGTLTQCPPVVQAIFKKVIAGWLGAGGTVQARKPGRISLKLKTKAHRSGWCARLPRNFNLLVLVAPKGKQPAHIQAEWNLARGEDTAYLDCIPEVVANYERTVSALPGFVRKGTLTKVFLNEKFTRRHAEALSTSIVSLKAAEYAAP